MSSLCNGCIFHDEEVCSVCKNLATLELNESLKQNLSAVEQIDGCLFPSEEVFLAQLAQSCTGKGVIVELGTYLGRSTASLGIGSNLGNKVKIYTFDSYEGDSAMETHPEMFHRMQDNLRVVGVDSIVEARINKTNFPPDDFNEPVELLFIDADHEFKATESDFDAWVSRVIVGGKIAFHDTYDIVQGGVRFCGPLKVIRKHCYDNPEFKILGRFQSITVVEKQEVKPEEVKPEEVKPEEVKPEEAPLKGSKIRQKPSRNIKKS